MSTPSGPSRRALGGIALAGLLGAAGCAPERPDAPAVDDPAAPVRHVELPGSSLGERGDYSVYVPSTGTDDATPWPVVYLLHGAGHDDSYWVTVGIAAATEAAVAAGEVAPMLVVMPDGGPTFASVGERTFDEYVTTELVPDVESRWRTRTDRGGRAVGGISLGGGRALELAADHPEVFAAVGGHSPVVRDATALSRAFARSKTRVFLDVGDGDGLRAGAESLHEALDRMAVPHDFSVGDGGHEESYWTARLPEYVAFYADALAGGGHP